MTQNQLRFGTGVGLATLLGYLMQKTPTFALGAFFASPNAKFHLRLVANVNPVFQWNMGFKIIVHMITHKFNKQGQIQDFGKCVCGGGGGGASW